MKEITYCAKDFTVSRDFVEITLGLDELFKKDKFGRNVRESTLIPVNLTNEKARIYETVIEVKADYQGLLNEVNLIENEIRREYLAKLIKGMIASIDYLALKQSSFRYSVRNLMYIDSNPVFEYYIADLKAVLEKKLKSAGYSGDLATMYSEWFQSRIVLKDKLEDTLNILINEAQTIVSETMFPQVNDLSVSPKVIYDAPYSAYANYETMEMFINGDFNYTYEDLKHLVTHEVFPGHFTHLYLRELELKNEKIPVDAGLVITNSVSSPIFEGIADCGQYFINWYQSINDEIAKIAQELKSVVTLNASYRLNELNQSEEEVGEYLKTFAFGQANWVKARLNFIKDDLRGPFIYAYHRGFEGTRTMYKKVSKQNEQNFWDILYKNMLTTDELKIYFEEDTNDN